MKELLQQFSDYHIWANELLLNTIKALPDEQQRAIVPSSFDSLFKTVLHIWDAESIWWQRINKQPTVTSFSKNFSGDFDAIYNGFTEQNRQWNNWIRNNTNEDLLRENITYTNSRNESFQQPLYQVLLHLFNHATYHRGQLVNMLRQLGVDKIPSTDFIAWSRKK